MKKQFGFQIFVSLFLSLLLSSGCDDSGEKNDECASGCLIEGICYPDGVINPSNSCQICNPGLSADNWSDHEGSCDDGLFCTVNDMCTAGVCEGTERICDDGIACNGSETCDEENQICTVGTPECDSGTLCNLETDTCVQTCTGCAISGICYGNGQINPANQCQICDLVTNASDWTSRDGESCDDGQFCTVNDACSAGVCEGSARSCDDGIACNGSETCNEDTDSCSSGTVTCTGGAMCDIATDSCLFACNGCIINEICYGHGSINLLNTCQICDMSQNSVGWTDRDGASCDDGLFCTINDTCSSGVCQGSARPCDDGISCNGSESCDETSDSCIAGVTTCESSELCELTTDNCVQMCTGCAISGICYGSGQTNPANQCQICDPITNDSTWTSRDGESCDDGLFCTVNDMCASDICEGTPRVCDDGIACNGSESCDEGSDTCTTGVTTCESWELCDMTADSCVQTCTGCAISGMCFGSGQINPANPCQICDTVADSFAWTDRIGESCDDGVNCTESDMCEGGGICMGTALACLTDRPCMENTGCTEGSGCGEVMNPACAMDIHCADICTEIGDTAKYFIYEISPAELSTSGGELVTLKGFFGDGSEVTIIAGGISVPVLSANSTTVTFSAPEASTDLDLVITGPGGAPVVRVFNEYNYGVPYYVTSSSMSLVYLAPVVTTVEGCSNIGSEGVTVDCEKDGGIPILVTGMNFGNDPSNLTVLIGDTECQELALADYHTRIYCNIPPMPEGDWIFNVTVIRDGKSGVKEGGLSYAGPYIAEVFYNDDVDPAGGSMLELRAGNISLPPDTSVWIGPTGTENECLILGIFSDTIRCIVPAGAGVGHEIRVKTGNLWSEPAPVFLNYRLPTIQPGSLTPDPLIPGGLILPLPTYPAQVYFRVDDLPTLYDTVNITYYDGINSNICHFPELTANSLSEPMVGCWIFGNLSSDGAVMGDSYFSISVWGATVNGTDMLQFGIPPQMATFSGCVDDGSGNTGSCPTEGGNTITVTGSDFSSSMQLAVNGITTAYNLISSNEITFTMPQGTGYASVQIILPSGLLSAAAAISYTRPVIDSVQGCPFTVGNTTHGCPVTGGTVITINGSDFGSSGAEVLIDKNQCTGVLHDALTPHRRITCILPPGTGLEVPVTVKAGTFTSDPARLSYLP
ncbi:IPT/TIG domain-containing protein [Myxococcota bacterium]|nr:IPT/TIG domain-containing protein [Myxococcota bacterium]MBU1381947.1 IPT/TIG domain-containing protein [Myxococcota bacterium]MBU1497848.1 IPT/TIG domain-containing protein [Myxococcota bacterium]